MVIKQGEIWWADFGEPGGSKPANVRPGVVIQSDRFNHSRLRTVVMAVITTNLGLAEMPGNIVLEPEQSGLPQTSVVNMTQLATLNKTDLLERIHQLSDENMASVEQGLRLVLGVE